MKEKIWDIEFEGHKIRAINRVSYFPPKTSEVLEIDGKVIEHVKGHFLRLYSTIFATYSFNGTEREVEVRIAQKAHGFGIGCQIFVDGHQICGDKAIQYPDPKKVEERLKKGFFRYFIRLGLLCFGLPFAILMAIFHKTDPALAMALKFGLNLFLFGLGMSYFSWRGFQSRAKSREQARVKSHESSNNGIEKDWEKTRS